MTSQNASAIECSQIKKSYDQTPAVRGLDLTVDRGESVAIIGPSGAGKTTILHLIGKIESPDRGTIQLNGRNISSYNPGRELSDIVGVMHQQFDLVDQLSAINNVLAGRLGEWGFWRAFLSLFIPQEAELAREALDRVGIEEKAYEKTSHLSGGEQQRVALARLLVQHPQIVLADEPVASVDPAQARNILQTLQTITSEEQLTLLVSLHSVDLALEFFPRIIGIQEGQVFFDRPPEKIRDKDLEQLYDVEGGPLHENFSPR